MAQVPHVVAGLPWCPEKGVQSATVLLAAPSSVQQGNVEFPVVCSARQSISNETFQSYAQLTLQWPACGVLLHRLAAGHSKGELSQKGGHLLSASLAVVFLLIDYPRRSQTQELCSRPILKIC